MASVKECTVPSGLTGEEVAVIAEHEHVPETVAVRLGTHLLDSADGLCLLKRFMLDNLERATHRGQFDKASQLAAMYRRFDADHPDSHHR